MNVGQTWAKLTEHQLATAAADLRNAALVVKHAGHFQGALVNCRDGSVCQVGAIELATYRTLVGPQTPDSWDRIGQSVFFSGYVATNHEHNVYRAENAIVCLSETIPHDLCDDCPVVLSECDCDRPYCGNHPEPWKIVTHYNDVHCVTPQLAINTLRMAAYNAEVMAASKRKALVSA